MEFIFKLKEKLNKWTVKDGGYTLLEMTLTMGFIGLFLLSLWTSYLFVYKTTMKSNLKAQNLEQAHMVINFINDTFQKYEMENLHVLVNGSNKELEEDDSGIVKQIKFKNGTEKIIIKYNPQKEIITFQNQEVASGIISFVAERKGQLINFDIEVQKSKNKGLYDTNIKTGAIISLKYN